MAKTDYRELMELLFTVYGILHGGVFRPGRAGEELGRTEFGLLAMLARKGSMRPSKAAELLNVSRPQMSAIADRLVARGLVARERDDEDRRMARIRATKPGKEVLEGAFAATEARIEELVSPLGEKELETVAVSLRRLVAALTKQQR